jgi:hypothetical protein
MLPVAAAAGSEYAFLWLLKRIAWMQDPSIFL